jgi:hypothetical protein
VPNIRRVVKSRRIRRVWYVASMGENRIAYRISAGKREGKDTTNANKVCNNNKVNLREIG